MTANTVFNAYLDANVILIMAAIIWGLTRFTISHTPLKYGFLLQLRLVYGVLIAVILAPAFVVLFEFAGHNGAVRGGYTPSLSDYVLSQYLNGQFEMSPLRFETLLTARTHLIQDVVGLRSATGVFVAASLAGGFIFFAALLLRNVLNVWGLIRRSYSWRKLGRVHICLTDEALVPFSTRTIRTQYIVLPSALLSQSNDLRMAVAHELQHIRQGDLAGEIILELLRPFLFWNPAFGYFKRQVENLRELSCDQQVLTRRVFAVKEYCDCLLRICRNALQGDNAGQILVPTVPFAQFNSVKHGHRSAKFLRYRIISMFVRSEFYGGKMLAGMMILPLMGMIAFGSIATQRSGDWSQDRLMLSTIVNLERMDQRSKLSP